MANGKDADPVSYGRWQEAHARLEDRITALERRHEADIAGLRGTLEEFTESATAALAKRRDRQWTMALAFLTGLALPLAVTALIALAGLH